MNRLLTVFCVLNIFLGKIGSSGIPVSRTRTTRTNVVSHAYCDSSLSEEDKMDQKTLEEVHTYAELKHDPRASLPDSFTICSAIMTTNCQNGKWPTYFTLLDNNRNQLLAPDRSSGSMESLFYIIYSKGYSNQGLDTLPPLFPNQWSKSCMTVNTTSGFIQWVVEGTLVLTTTSEEVKESKSKPKDLSKKLVLGARSYGGRIWVAPTHKVAT